MPSQQARTLDVAMEHVVRDTEHFLEDLKGRKHFKGLVKNDVQHLKEHLRKLMGHLAQLETGQAEWSSKHAGNVTRNPKCKQLTRDGEGARAGARGVAPRWLKVGERARSDNECQRPPAPGSIGTQE